MDTRRGLLLSVLLLVLLATSSWGGGAVSQTAILQIFFLQSYVSTLGVRGGGEAGLSTAVARCGVTWYDAVLLLVRY